MSDWEQIHQKLDTIQISVRRCEVLLTGNGTPERGVIVRLDRVERYLRGHKKLLLGVLGLVVAPCAVSLLLWLFRGI